MPTLTVLTEPPSDDTSSLAGALAVVVDQLRASVTITAALASGAPWVRPVLRVADALAAAERLGRQNVLLGGERAGLLIAGFDLDNSPRAYTRDRLAGRPVILTTTNGTAALLRSARAERVLVGSVANLSAVGRELFAVERVCLVCAATGGEPSMDDCIAAGAFVEHLVSRRQGWQFQAAAEFCLDAWRSALAPTDPAPGERPGSVSLARSLALTAHGRHLIELGFGPDVEFCAVQDRYDIVPRFDAATGLVTIARP